MNRVLAFLEAGAESIARRTARLGETVRLDAGLLDRSAGMTLQAPGLWSPNRSCRLVKAKDGWIAANLPREDDLQSMPALLAAMPDADPWDSLIAKAPHFACADLVARAEMLGLAVASVGETPAPPQSCHVETINRATRSGASLRVVDFSSLWAGPLCGSIFAAMGADVVKIKSAERPDTTAHSAPLLDQRLNGAKRKQRIALRSKGGLDALWTEIVQADVLITSARARALDALGVSRERVFAARPSLVWIAITGHGWSSARIAFGDDAAASGNLIAREGDEPRFIGDALADPLTGLAAADCALGALEQGGSAFIDAALARTAAYVAAFGA